MRARARDQARAGAPAHEEQPEAGMRAALDTAYRLRYSGVALAETGRGRRMPARAHAPQETNVMPRFEVAWSYGGYTSVEAATEAEARERFAEMNHKAILDACDPADDDGLNVVYVAEDDSEDFATCAYCRASLAGCTPVQVDGADLHPACAEEVTDAEGGRLDCKCGASAEHPIHGHCRYCHNTTDARGICLRGTTCQRERTATVSA
jgi:hypothetical protein